MVDTRTTAQRSRIMSSVGTRNTGPEMAVRRILHRLGYRFRLHRADLPGKPDIVLPAHRAVIMVHGCFWHSHGCSKGRPPKTRTDYWGPKLARNVERDREVMAALEGLGWRSLVVWQCEMKDMSRLEDRLQTFMTTKKSIDVSNENSYSDH